MNIRYTHFKGSLYLLCSVLCWGMVPLFLRSFIQELDAWTANGFPLSFLGVALANPIFDSLPQGKC